MSLRLMEEKLSFVAPIAGVDVGTRAMVGIGVRVGPEVGVRVEATQWKVRESQTKPVQHGLIPPPQPEPVCLHSGVEVGVAVAVGLMRAEVGVGVGVGTVHSFTEQLE